MMRGFGTALLGATVAAAVAGVAGGSVQPYAARMGSASASRAETATDISGLRLADPHKELRHLSKNLRLSREQRTAVGGILQERSREIHLLLDIQPASQETRNAVAAKVMEDSNSQIESFLKSKQKRKFARELARDHRPR
jgi:predicted transcriptional regulator